MNKRSYTAIVISMVIILIELANSIYLFYYSPSTYKIPNIFHAPIETIPFDPGWIGLALILVNGFLLSYVLVKDEVDIIERLLLSIGLGFGVTYTGMILIGMLWEISLLTVVLTQMSIFVTLLIAAFCRGMKQSVNSWLSLKKKTSFIPKFNIFEAILLIVTAIFIIVAIYQTVAYPAMEWDSLAYGVNYAKVIFENGKIPLIAGPSIGLQMSASYPPGVQLLAVYLYEFAGNMGDFYFRILQPICGLATLLVTYKFSIAVTRNRTAAIFAMFTLASMSTFWELFVHETYLICLTLMMMLAAFFFFKAYKSNGAEAEKFEVAATLFCCFSALTSYMGLFAFGLLLVYSLNRKLAARRFAGLAMLSSVIVLPWYIRNLILLGNPLFPFFGIGNYLDPVLLSSTTQHFQNWANVPFFALFSITAKIGAGALCLGVIYLTFAKRKQFFLVFPCYLLLIGITIMGVHIPFVRYLIVALPALAIVLSASAKWLLQTRALLGRAVGATLVLLVLISSVLVLPCINSVKPSPTNSDDKWSYLDQIFEEGEAWKWIKENTPEDARIATYDLKDYYIERSVFTLDGNEAAPLYEMDDIEEIINFLEERNVTHMLSVPWAAPLDPRMPPAYKWCVLTRYLGDPQYLPPVYVGSKGAAVYHVGSLEEETVYASFAQENFAPPIKQLTVNVTVTNSTSVPNGKFHLPVPADYREGLMMVSVNSSKRLVSVELWQGEIPEVVTNPSGTYIPLKQWPIQTDSSVGVENPSFVWQINKWGYFTLFVVDQEETFEENVTVTVDIQVYNYWDINSLFISEGSEIHDITSFDETFPLLKTLYIKANESSILNVNSMTSNKKISLEVFSGFLPNNAVINWSAQYNTVTRQPSLNNHTGEVDPSIQNLPLPSGHYSILVVYRDSYTEQVDISLEIELVALS